MRAMRRRLLNPLVALTLVGCAASDCTDYAVVSPALPAPTEYTERVFVGFQSESCTDGYFELAVIMKQQQPVILLADLVETFRASPTGENQFRLAIAYLYKNDLLNADRHLQAVNPRQLCPAAQELLSLYKAQTDRAFLKTRLSKAEAKLEALSTIEQRIESERSKDMKEPLGD